MSGRQLAEIGAALKAASDGGVLRRELLAGIRKGAKPLVEEVRQAAREKLPKAGGLNERVADSPIAVRTRLSGRTAGVRIVNTRKGTDQGGSGVRFGTDTGRLRHPVFGRQGAWVTQQIANPGWFTATLNAHAKDVTPEVLAAMKIAAEKIMLRGR